MARRVRGAILLGLLTGTVLAVAVEAIWHLGPATEHRGGWKLSVPALTGSPFALPDLSLLGDVSFGSFSRIGTLAATALVFTLVFANFFDALGTLTGLSREAGSPTRRGTFPASPPHWSSRERGRWSAGRRRHRRTPCSSSPAPVSAEEPVPAWRIWSPGRCFWRRCS